MPHEAFGTVLCAHVERRQMASSGFSLGRQKRFFQLKSLKKTDFTMRETKHLKKKKSLTFVRCGFGKYLLSLPCRGVGLGKVRLEKPNWMHIS